MYCHSDITSLGRFALEHITGAHAGPPMSRGVEGHVAPIWLLGSHHSHPAMGCRLPPCSSNQVVIVWSGKVISQH